VVETHEDQSALDCRNLVWLEFRGTVRPDRKGPADHLAGR